MPDVLIWHNVKSERNEKQNILEETNKIFTLNCFDLKKMDISQELLIENLLTETADKKKDPDIFHSGSLGAGGKPLVSFKKFKKKKKNILGKARKNLKKLTDKTQLYNRMRVVLQTRIE